MENVLSILSELFEKMPIGLVVLDREGHVVIYNRAEELLAGRPRTAVLGRKFFVDVAPCMSVKQFGGVFQEKIGVSPFDVEVEFSFPFRHIEPRDVRVRMTSLDVKEEPHAFLMIEDLSKQRSIERMKGTLQNLLVHDMKNPLATMMGNLHLLTELPSVRDNLDAFESVMDSLDAAHRVEKMLVDLLDIDRLETDSLPLRRAQIDLRDVMRLAAEDNQVVARRGGVSVKVVVPEAPVHAYADGEVLRRAINNLVENAIRHGRRVELSTMVREGNAIVEVCDDGPGIPSDLQARIFDKYVQVSQPLSLRGHNRGLGLTFVRLAARAHGGEAIVDCPESGGTRFRLVLAAASP